MNRYKVAELVVYGLDELETKLNALADEGWRVVGAWRIEEHVGLVSAIVILEQTELPSVHWESFTWADDNVTWTGQSP